MNLCTVVDGERRWNMIYPYCGMENYDENRKNKIDEFLLDWFEKHKDEKIETPEYIKWNNRKNTILNGIDFENKDKIIGDPPEQFEQKKYGIRYLYMYRNDDIKHMNVNLYEFKESLNRLILCGKIKVETEKKTDRYFK